MSSLDRASLRKKASGTTHYSPKTKTIMACTGNCAYGQNSVITDPDTGEQYQVLHPHTDEMGNVIETQASFIARIDEYERTESLKRNKGDEAAATFGTVKKPLDEKEDKAKDLSQWKTLSKSEKRKLIKERAEKLLEKGNADETLEVFTEDSTNSLQRKMHRAAKTVFEGLRQRGREVDVTAEIPLEEGNVINFAIDKEDTYALVQDNSTEDFIEYTIVDRNTGKKLDKIPTE